MRKLLNCFTPKVSHFHQRKADMVPIPPGAKEAGVMFLGCEEQDTREKMASIHDDLINLCKQHGAILDLATSDVVIYVRDCSPELAKILYERFEKEQPGGGGTYDEAEREYCA